MGFRDQLSWWVGLFALPLLVAQAYRTRRSTPRLPSASAPHSGVYRPADTAISETLSVYLVGESTVAGVGARDHEHGLSGQLAERLGEQLARPIRWEAIGVVGATARDCLDYLIELELVRRLEAVPADLIVIVLGVNDTTKLTPRARWRDDLRAIVARCRRETTCPIAFTGIPPMHHFSALRWPLRSVIGARARLLDEDLQLIAMAPPKSSYHDINVALDGDDLAADGFHPSEHGYARWADELALQLTAELTR